MTSISSYLSKASKSLGKPFQAAFSERSSDKSDKNRRDSDPVRDYRTDLHICPAYVIQNSLKKTITEPRYHATTFIHSYSDASEAAEKNSIGQILLQSVGISVRLPIGTGFLFFALL